MGTIDVGPLNITAPDDQDPVQKGAQRMQEAFRQIGERVVPAAGGTVTGPITLTYLIDDSSADNVAVTKKYVDELMASLDGTAGGGAVPPHTHHTLYLRKDDDTAMDSGKSLSVNEPTSDAHAASKKYVDTTTATAAAQSWKRWIGTQAQYDALAAKDPNTLYVVV